MGFDYEAKLTAVKNALEDFNTLTSSPDLSSGLTTRVQTILIDDIDSSSLRADDFPIIFVRVANKDEDFSSLGMTGLTGSRKECTVEYEVTGLYKKDGNWDQSIHSMLDLYRLANNIESVFQNEMTLSGTALWCNPLTTRFDDPINTKGTWVKGVTVALQARYQFQ